MESPPFTGDHGAGDEAPDSSTSPSSDTPPGIPTAPSAPRGRLQLRILWLIVVVALLAGVATRITNISHRGRLSHDEALTYLTLTGHRDTYWDTRRSEQPPYGVWSSAAEWQQFLDVDRAFCFAAIQDNPSKGLHPPLYFWVAHIWSLVFGTSHASGLALNLLIDLLTGLVLYRLARRVLGRPVAAAAVVAIWLLSPAVTEIGLEARSYSLLTFFGLLLVLQTMTCSDASRPLGRRRYVGLTAVVAGGLLTHVGFVMVAIGCGLVMLARLMERAPRRLMALTVAGLLGVTIAIAVHPHLMGLSRLTAVSQRLETQGFRPANEPGETASRWVDTLSGHSLFVTRHPGVMSFVGENARVVGAIGVALLLVLLLALIAPQVWHGRWPWRPPSADQWTVLFLLLWIDGLLVALFLSGVSPSYTMLPKYLCLVWPLAAVIVVMLADRLPVRWTAITLMVAIMIASAVQYSLSLTREHRQVEGWKDMFRSGRPVVIDNPQDGVLMPLVHLMSADTQIYAASPARVLTRAPEIWAAAPSGGYFLTNMSYEATPEQTQRTLSATQALGRTVTFEGSFRLIRYWSPILVFRVGPR